MSFMIIKNFNFNAGNFKFVTSTTNSYGLLTSYFHLNSINEVVLLKQFMVMLLCLSFTPPCFLLMFVVLLLCNVYI